MLNKLNQDNRHNLYINWIIIFTFSVLIVVGFLVQYSVGGGEIYPFFFHQLLMFGISLPILVMLFLLQNEVIAKSSYYVYLVSILLLIVAAVFGKKVMGATRWISVFGVTLQPSESMKVSIILALAYTLHNFSELKIASRSKISINVFLIAIIPTLLILRQPNLGTASVVCFIIFVILFSVGINIKYFLYLGLCWFISLPIMWQFLYDYQKNRIFTFLGINEDPLGKGYNILQSKIAIGSGGLFGRGFLEGTQTQLKFLPEKHSDFVFTVFAEEIGFFGGLIVIVTYTVFCLEALYIGVRSHKLFNRITAIGISAMFFFHYFVNIGMVMGILPIVGIPLPFISYGGSIMFTSVVSVGLLLNIHRSNLMHNASMNTIRRL